jgi:hydrogenase/urease accessory protein HupE
MKKWITAISSAALILSSNMALAHPVDGGTSLFAGLTHSASGLDYLIGILLVGILAWVIGSSND